MPQLLAEDYRSIEHFVSPNAFLGHKDVVVTLFVTLGRLDLYIPICTYIYLNVCLFVYRVYSCIRFRFFFSISIVFESILGLMDGYEWGWRERHFMGWPLFLFWHLIYFRYDRQLSFSVFTYIYKNVYSRKYFKQMHLHILVVTHENGANVKCGTIYSIASAFPFFCIS